MKSGIQAAVLLSALVVVLWQLFWDEDTVAPKLSELKEMVMPAQPNSTAQISGQNSAAACSAERLATWKLVGVDYHNTKGGSAATLYADGKGPVMVNEGQPVDRDIVLRRVERDKVELVCGDVRLTRSLAGSPATRPVAPLGN